ncbi:DUF222 domain-containing protein, partial [Aeromicrobium sp.]|uniref:DUF222 domain-containing protein n=1 Tax=Aeromicrobium sp. TaxID=1871063 RepID=UPI0019C89CB6
MLCPVSSTPAAVIGCADAQLAPLGGRLWAAVSDADLVEGLGALIEVEAHLAALQARLLGEIATRDLARKKLAWASTGEWYAHTAGITRGAAHRAVVHAQLLVGEREATLAALEAGHVSGVQAGVICAAIDQLPTNPTLRADAEERLLVEAAHLDATQLTAAGKRILTVIDPDRDERRA